MTKFPPRDGQPWPRVDAAEAGFDSARLAAATRFALEHETLAGPVNLTCPEPVTNRDFARELGRALRRPALLPAPAPALRLALGGFADSILMSQRVLPKALLAAGFRFEHPTAADAVRALTDPGAKPIGSGTVAAPR